MILFLQAMFGLFSYDVLNAVYPFQRLCRIARGWKVSQRYSESEVIDRVCTAVNYACVWYPKRALCLQRSFVTTHLLRMHGVSASMVFGAQRLPFKAHAWVEVDGKAINERSNVQAAYAVWERC